VHLPVVASPVEVAAAMTGGVKRLFLRHILQYTRLCFLSVHVFFVPFRTRTQNNTAKAFRTR